MSRPKRLPIPIGFTKQKDGTYKRRGEWVGEARKYFSGMEYTVTGEAVSDPNGYATRLKHRDGRIVQIFHDRTHDLTRITVLEAIGQ